MTLEATADILPEAPHRITVLSDFRAKDFIKVVPGARWDTVSKRWTVPLSWPSCLALRAEFGKGLTIGPTLKMWASDMAAVKKRLLASHPLLELDAEAAAKIPGLPGFDGLYPFQLVDADVISWAGNYLLMNETGAGKSRSAAAGMSLLDAQGHDIFPLLVVAPKSMLITWSRELEPFFPGKDVRTVAGTPKKCKDALEPGGDIYIIGWETLRTYSRVAGFGSIALTATEKQDKEIQAIGFHSAIFDECHRAKNPLAKRTRAAWAAAEDCIYRVGLTGTPIQDTPEDLYGVLHLLFPDEYPTKTPFVERYCTPPDSPVLMADWSLQPVGDVKVGDRVVGFAKQAGSGYFRTEFSPTKVTAVTRRPLAPLVRATLSDGQEIVCTPDHLWLNWSRTLNPHRIVSGKRTVRREHRFTEVAPGTSLLRMLTPPGPCPLNDGERGWLAGMLDGEGSVNKSRRGAPVITISQSLSHNPDICHELDRVLTKLGASYTWSKQSNVFRIRGGIDGFLTFMQAVKPWSVKMGLLSEYATSRGQGEVTVIDVQDEPAGEVVSLTTELGTYVVHGLASHNCNVDWNEWGGREIKGLHPTRGGEFLANLDTISRRLTKAMVLPFLPEKVYEIRWVTLPPALRKIYKEMETTMVAELEESTMKAENALVKAGRLIQLANSAGDVDADGVFHMHAPSPKVDAFLEDVESGDFDGQQVVVFSDSRELINVLAEAMTKKKIEYVTITGSVTGDDRQKAMDAFQASEVPFCLLTKAGGEGITLTAASTMVRLMRPWSLTVHKQVEDRVHRIGSEIHESVTYIDYITEDTLEMGQIVRLNAKEGRAQEVLRDEELLRLIKEGK